MYEEFYGLHSKPFQLNPDPGFYFASKQHRRAKAYLDYGVLRNEGFIVITGEIGAGKTTLLRGLLDGLEASKIVAAQLVSTQLDAENVLRMVCAAFGVSTKNVSKADLLMALEVFFVSQVGQGKRCLLVVDEAQNLTLEAIEELRMLSNFQFGQQALLQSFLIGQPEFINILRAPQMQQLKQRVIAACHIGALDEQETKDYIAHRLKVSGLTQRAVFDDSALRLIFELSGGIPRKINLVCDRLLLQGFLNNSFLVTADDVMQVRKEIQEEHSRDCETQLEASVGTSSAGSALRQRADDYNTIKEGKQNNVDEKNFMNYQDCLQRLEHSLLNIEEAIQKILVVLHNFDAHIINSWKK